MKNLVATLIAGTVFAVLAGYTVFWHITATQIEKEIAILYDDAEKSGYRIEGDAPVVTGFPGKHRIRYSGWIQQAETSLVIPKLEIYGFPLPGQEIAIIIPDGIYLDENGQDSEIYSLDTISMTGIIPETLPDRLTVEGLRAWIETGTKINISDFSLGKNSLLIQGNGVIGLDSSLQPEGQMSVTVEGHMAFLGFLQRKNIIEPKEAMISGTVLTGLSQQNPETGERFLTAGFTLYNRQLLLGPLRIMEIPEISWPYDAPLSLFEREEQQLNPQQPGP